MTPNIIRSAPLQGVGCSGEQERSQLLLVPDSGGGAVGRVSGAAPQRSGRCLVNSRASPSLHAQPSSLVPAWWGRAGPNSLLCPLARSSASGELCPCQVAVESAGVAMKRGSQGCSDLRSRWTLTAKGACKTAFISFPEERDVENEAGGENEHLPSFLLCWRHAVSQDTKKTTSGPLYRK